MHNLIDKNWFFLKLSHSLKLHKCRNRSNLFCIEKIRGKLACLAGFFGFDIVGSGKSGNTSIRCSHHDLSGKFGPLVPDNIKPRDICFTFFIGDHISFGIHFNPTRHQCIVGIKTNEYKCTIRRQIPLFGCFCTF